jgi:homoserine kinase type II
LAIKTQLSHDDIVRVTSEWGLGALQSWRGLPEGSINTLYSLTTVQGKFVLRLSEGRRSDEVLFETGLLQHLTARHYPAVTLVSRIDGGRTVLLRDRYACVFRWGAGEHIRKRLWTLEQAHDAGRHLARLHVLTEDFNDSLENRYSPAVVTGWVAALAAESRSATRRDDPEVWAALPLFEREAAALASLPPAAEGIIHADYFPDNLLFVGDRIATVLDFEMACRGPFMLDLATALNACCYDDDFVRPRMHALVRGYREEREPSSAEWSALQPWARFSALRFACSRVRDFHRSDLGADRLQKKDWRRFRDRLQRLIELDAPGLLDLCGVQKRNA